MEEFEVVTMTGHTHGFKWSWSWDVKCSPMHEMVLYNKELLPRKCPQLSTLEHDTVTDTC